MGRYGRIASLVVVLAAAISVIGCGGAQPADPARPQATASPDELPTNLPVATPTLASGGADSATPMPVDEYGLPIGLTGYEIIAARAGEAPYSGYACVIAPVGCACEEPIVERVSFTFDDDGHLDYHFAGDGYEATWRMTRLGASQWGYTQRYVLEGTDIRVAHIVLLTFTDTGFIRNEGGDMSDGTIVTCPDVPYRRLAMPTEEP